MSDIKHKEVSITYYSIVLSSSNRMMPSRLNEFFSELDIESLGDDWQDNQMTLRDYEGDFEGVEIYHCDAMIPVYQYIAEKLNVDVKTLGETSIRITNI